MPSHSELPSSLRRSQIENALKRLGWIRRKGGGKGSHIKMTWPRANKSLTIPKRIEKDVLFYLLKEIEKYSGHTWEDIKKNI